MGSGSWSSISYASYSSSLGRSIDNLTGRTTGGQSYTARSLDKSLDPKGVIRECCISEEHPNPIPVILALDVTGSMGPACKETSDALGEIMKNLYEKYKDIEFLMMGIGDLAYDSAPIQASQFESDIRIAEAKDKIWLEKGGGGNSFESYTAAWYFGLHNTKLEPFEEQGRKGIIITMGDEPMNPYLPCLGLNDVLGSSEQIDVETSNLYHQASEKFDIFHIAVDDRHNCYSSYKEDIEKSFGQLLGKHFKTSEINTLSKVICECIDEAINGESFVKKENPEQQSSGKISW